MTHTYKSITGSHSKCSICECTRVDGNRKYYYIKGSNKPVAREPECIEPSGLRRLVEAKGIKVEYKHMTKEDFEYYEN